MKKSLLLTSLTFIFISVFSCQNMHTTGLETNTDSKLVSSDSIPKPDTIKSKNQTETSGLVGTGKGIIKDTANYKGPGTAIIHHAQNQDKIDSIKKLKTKTK
jgi:hypothetical protein